MLKEENRQALIAAGERCIELNPEHGGTGREAHKRSIRDLDVVIAAVKKSQPELFYSAAEERAREIAAELRG